MPPGASWTWGAPRDSIPAMHKNSSALVALSLFVSASAVAAQSADHADIALAGDTIAWDYVEGLTTEVGPRQAGTEAEARARAWSIAWLKANGFANVANEPFMMDTWVRGAERAEIVSPFAQPFHVTALGGSGSTGAQGITAPVVMFKTLADLEAAAAGSLAGKIAYISHAMTPTQDGSQYGFAGPARWVGASIAAQKGALASVIKSVGTDYHRNPHTGGTRVVDGMIPAGALSLPDAANLERMVQRAAGRPLMMKLTLTPQNIGQTESGNVVGEIIGRDPALPPVLLACHLDSWDLGTGAIDDGAGCAIIAAAARHASMAARPLRTIRVLFAGAEEVGLWGSKAYSAAHLDEPVGAGLESDFGADRIWQIQTSFGDRNPALVARLAAAVARFGVAPSTTIATGGADIDIVRDQKGAIIELQQDGTGYFNLHHTPDDTLDKIDPAQLRQNVAVWTAVVQVLANEPGPITGAP